MASTLKRFMIGRPLASAEADHQRIPKTIGLAVFSSDAISSTAYATQEILLVLVPVGGMALLAQSNYTFGFLTPIAILVALLLIVVANSYRQTIHAYPDGGGAYVVSRENLGEVPALIAGGSLLVDYVLTVSVSVAAGTQAIYSAVPSVAPFKVLLCLGFIALLTLANLRGVKESGRLFAAPTYIYIFALTALIAFGFYKMTQGTLQELPPDLPALAKLKEETGTPLLGLGGITIFLFARAFSSGAVALSGVEAISNGIPAFKKPTSKNAAITLVWMATILGFSFIGLTVLAEKIRPTPSETGESVNSIIGRTVFGGTGFMYWVLQISTAGILILAANTAYADFPRLAALVGKDGYLPRQFANRGDRLVFSNGILFLAGAASLLIVVFGGNVSALIPLYAVGVFTSFTLSQSGMVRHHLRLKERGWRLSVVFSVLGAIATFIVMMVVIISKFTIGAWIPVALIPIIVVAFKSVKKHYAGVAKKLRVPAGYTEPDRVPGHGVVVLVGGVNQSSLAAIRYARSVNAKDAIAVTVALDDEHADRIREEWERHHVQFPLEIIESPYRDLTGTVEDYLDELDQRWKHDYVSVVIAEFVLPHWYQGIFHNQSALALKLALKFRKDTVVVNVPYHLGESDEEVAKEAADLGLSGRGPDQQPTVDIVVPGAKPSQESETADSSDQDPSDS
ncbi:amino acid/polyamine/organocation transporter, APC superfamily [Actinobacteria bacterium IMCC26207]|nr:amino acid/polyamine/organocation transporter, APC superfamily [Actinobacteria bacterium IMCC26207]